MNNNFNIEHKHLRCVTKITFVRIYWQLKQQDKEEFYLKVIWIIVHNPGPLCKGG